MYARSQAGCAIEASFETSCSPHNLDCALMLPSASFLRTASTSARESRIHRLSYTCRQACILYLSREINLTPQSSHVISHRNLRIWWFNRITRDLERSHQLGFERKFAAAAAGRSHSGMLGSHRAVLRDLHREQGSGGGEDGLSRMLASGVPPARPKQPASQHRITTREN